MATTRGDGPLTTDDGWWQQADGSWHPPHTHPLRDVAGFLETDDVVVKSSTEDLPEPPTAEQAARHGVDDDLVSTAVEQTSSAEPTSSVDQVKRLQERTAAKDASAAQQDARKSAVAGTRAIRFGTQVADAQPSAARRMWRKGD